MDPSTARQAFALFLQALEGQRRAGQTTLRLGPAEREAMRQWPALLKQTAPAPATRAGANQPAKTPAQSGRMPAADASPAPATGNPAADALAEARRQLQSDRQPPRATQSAPQATSTRPTPAAEPAASGPADGQLLPTEGVTREEQIASLERQAADWPAARELGTLRPTLVFSTGNPQAPLMLVGEAPGSEEELRREPFVGPAGNMLDKILKAMGLDRKSVYISNICKFRPLIQGQSTNNRKPTAEEMRACLPFILTEIEIVRPGIIVALGASAAEGLLGFTDPVGRLRARLHRFGDIPAVVTYHPSYLLRNQALSEKRKVWEDMLLVMETLDMPVSDKQRSFFLKA